MSEVGTFTLNNLKAIVDRAEELPPVIYQIAIPGTLAIQLNFMAIENSTTVEDQVIESIEKRCNAYLWE